MQCGFIVYLREGLSKCIKAKLLTTLNFYKAFFKKQNKLGTNLPASFFV